ncbi:hypothetical protein AWV79_35665 [Cupriavidus sp. UYMMa02A]|nr:hypothetical protein AWV79_35665 [Cupriavidus sp. UYMMa02A]
MGSIYPSYDIARAEHARLPTALDMLQRRVNEQVDLGYEPIGNLCVEQIPVSAGEFYYVVCQPLRRRG